VYVVAEDQLARLIQRGLNDPSFAERARTDLEGTLAAEGISLSPEELAAARSYQAEVAGLSADEVRARLASASAQQSTP
jgi:hypothetical protein